MKLKSIAALNACLILAACGGGGGTDAPAPPPPVVNQSIGGIWTGKDNSGNDIIALSTETGQFHFLDITNDAQGFGTATVSATPWF